MTWIGVWPLIASVLLFCKSSVSDPMYITFGGRWSSNAAPQHTLDLRGFQSFHSNNMLAELHANWHVRMTKPLRTIMELAKLWQPRQNVILAVFMLSLPRPDPCESGHLRLTWPTDIERDQAVPPYTTVLIIWQPFTAVVLNRGYTYPLGVPNTATGGTKHQHF